MTVRVGACQTPEILGDVDAAIRVIEGFATDRADLLVFPECFLQGYLVTGEHVRQHALDAEEVAARLAHIRPTLVIGFIERLDGIFHNSAVVVTGGRVVCVYRKTFLVDGEAVFTPGDTYPTFELGGVRFGLNICYDTQFPQAAAGVAEAGADVLLVPAQNMMRREKAPSWQHRHNEIRVRRVRETGLWLISADVTGSRGDTHVGLGPTCAIDPEGRVVSRVPTGTVGMAVAEVRC